MFEKLRDAGTLAHAAAPRNFGIALVLLGIAMLIVGIVYHVQFMIGLRQERDAMTRGRADPRRERLPAFP